MNGGFADRSLNHLGTPPQARMSAVSLAGPALDCNTVPLSGTGTGVPFHPHLYHLREVVQVRDFGVLS